MNYQKKERDLTQSNDENPYTNRKFNNQYWQHKDANQNFDYTGLWTDLGLSVGVTTAF